MSQTRRYDPSFEDRASKRKKKALKMRAIKRDTRITRSERRRLASQDF